MLSPNAFLAPGQLTSTPGPVGVNTRSDRPTKRRKHIGILTPGAVHCISQSQSIPTPGSILDGSYNAAQDIVMYLPRRAEWSGLPSIPSITFSDMGRPGPTLRDIVKGRVCVDHANDTMFEEHGWRKTAFYIDWPGCTLNTVQLSAKDQDGQPLTRGQLAYILASHIARLIVETQSGVPLPYGPQHIDASTSPWALQRINYRDVRLLAVNYYRKVWIPVLAVNASS